MNSLGDQFLAGAALTGNEDSRSRGGDLFDDAKNLLHDVRAADDGAAIDLPAHRLAERAPLFFFATAFDTGCYGGADVFVLKRLTNTTESAFLPRGDGGVERCVSGNHHHYSFRIQLEKFLQRAQAADARHRHVQQYSVIGTLGVSVQSFFTSLGEIDSITLGREQGLEHV